MVEAQRPPLFLEVGSMSWEVWKVYENIIILKTDSEESFERIAELLKDIYVEWDGEIGCERMISVYVGDLGLFFVLRPKEF